MKRDELLSQILSVRWDQLRSQVGMSEYVPDAFRRLIDARTEAEAGEAYWLLDNGVIVQGRLYEAAQTLAPFLVEALQLPLTAAARHDVVELLTELSLGVTSDDEARRGNTALRERTRAAVRPGLVHIYKLLIESDPRIRRATVHALDAVETDRARLATALRSLRDTDDDAEVRQLIDRILGAGAL